VYCLQVTATDANGNIFKNKYSISLASDGRINMDSSPKDRTLFIYLFRDDKFVSYCESDSGNQTTVNSHHDNDNSVEFDGDKDYSLYLDNPTTSDHHNDHSIQAGGETKVDSSGKR
jgi:hypothetical protein